MKNSTPYNVFAQTGDEWSRIPRAPVAASLIASGNAIFAAVGLQTSSLALLAATGLIAQVGVSLITSWAVAALTPKPDLGGVDSRGLLVNTRDPVSPQDFVYGQVRKGGVITYIESTGTSNRILHQIICLAGHEVEEVGDVYINEEVVTLSSDGYSSGDRTGTGWVTSPVKWSKPSNSSEHMVRILKHDGSQTAVTDTFANSSSVTMTATLGAETNAFGGTGQPDFANMVGEGIAFVYARLGFDADVFSNGIPLITTVVKGKKVYDPRTGTTAYSNNAALVIRDYLTSAYGLNDSQIDDASFSVAANVCDEDVALAAGGTEKRYAINGVIRANTPHGQVLERMMTACAGTLFWGGGKWKLVVGDYIAPVKTLTIDDLRSPISLQTKTSLSDQFNIVQGTFNSADDDWITLDYPPYPPNGVTNTYLTEDNNVESPLDLQLPFTTSASAVQRIAKLTLLRGRLQKTLTADFGLNAFDVEVGEIIALTIDRYGWAAKEFEVQGWNLKIGDQGDLRVSLTLRETSEDAFAWSAEEQDILSEVSEVLDYTDGVNVTNLTYTASTEVNADGTVVPSAILEWGNGDLVDYYEVQWKQDSVTNWNSTTTANTSIEVYPLVSGQAYTARVRAINTLGYSGDYSTVSFTSSGDTVAPGLPTSISASGYYDYITVAWTNPSDTDFKAVRVYASDTNDSGAASLVGEVSSTEFNHTGLGNNTTKYYFLKSVDTSGNASAFTASVTATTLSDIPVVNLDVTGNATIAGNLTVNGTTTILNTQELTVEDINITIANGAANAAAANGAGITVDGANATITYASATDSWNLNKTTFIGGSQVLVFGDNISELTNDSGYISDFTGFTTDDLTEGVTNFYYTDARANAAIDARVTKAFVDALNVDANTLDGVDSTSFLRSDQADTASGKITFASSVILQATAQPVSPVLGETYLDSSDNIVYTWDGTNWRPHYGSYLELE